VAAVAGTAAVAVGMVAVAGMAEGAGHMGRVPVGQAQAGDHMVRGRAAQDQVDRVAGRTVLAPAGRVPAVVRMAAAHGQAATKGKSLTGAGRVTGTVALRKFP
jgi:hypothetical protein